MISSKTIPETEKKKMVIKQEEWTLGKENIHWRIWNWDMRLFLIQIYNRQR